MRIQLPVVVAIAVITAAVSFAVGQANPEAVRMMKLPLPLPAVGNVDGVKQWRFGRIEEIQRSENELLIRIRLANGATVDVSGPREPLARLGRQCGWVSSPTQTVAGRSDYVERMIAFDADANGRIIAVMSMEPFNRSSSRLRRVFGGR